MAPPVPDQPASMVTLVINLRFRLPLYCLQTQEQVEHTDTSPEKWEGAHHGSSSLYVKEILLPLLIL
jgi:hypothetical protein